MKRFVETCVHLERDADVDCSQQRCGFRKRPRAGHTWRCLTADVGGDAAGADLLVAQDLGVEECPVAVAGR